MTSQGSLAPAGSPATKISDWGCLPGACRKVRLGTDKTANGFLCLGCWKPTHWLHSKATVDLAKLDGSGIKSGVLKEGNVLMAGGFFCNDCCPKYLAALEKVCRGEDPPVRAIFFDAGLPSSKDLLQHTQNSYDNIQRKLTGLQASVDALAQKPPGMALSYADVAARIKDTVKVAVRESHKDERQDEERARSLVIDGLKPSADASDEDMVKGLLKAAQAEPGEIKRVVRVGKEQGGRVAKTKVIMASPAGAAAALTRQVRQRLREPAFQANWGDGIYISPSRTYEERRELFLLRARRRHLNAGLAEGDRWFVDSTRLCLRKRTQHHVDREATDTGYAAWKADFESNETRRPGGAGGGGGGAGRRGAGVAGQPAGAGAGGAPIAVGAPPPLPPTLPPPAGN